MAARILSATNIDRKYGEEVDPIEELKKFIQHIGRDECISISFIKDNNETSIAEETLIIKGDDFNKCIYFNTLDK